MLLVNIIGSHDLLDEQAEETAHEVNEEFPLGQQRHYERDFVADRGTLRTVCPLVERLDHIVEHLLVYLQVLCLPQKLAELHYEVFVIDSHICLGGQIRDVGQINALQECFLVREDGLCQELLVAVSQVVLQNVIVHLLAVAHIRQRTR